MSERISSMPIFFPHVAQRSRLRPESSTTCRVRACVRRWLGASLWLACGVVWAQTLAHPNWVGNGMSTDPWWQHAVIYRVGVGVGVGAGAGVNALSGEGAGSQANQSPGEFRSLASRINAFRSIGVDALLLAAPPIPVQGDGAEPGGAGTQQTAQQIDELDDLVRVASGRGVRILLTLTPGRATDDLTGVARFWLNHGIAGFHVTTPAGASAADTLAMVQTLRRLTAGVVGQ
ncbi:MAG: alpha-amylase family protein, partial [Acidobacteriota bacterium]|nr:alpha-amylase family protein [Acidobacteriota bacterium]